MTYKELLHSISFQEVEPHLVNMDPEAKDSLGWFKLHYDMLKLMCPKYHEDANENVCRITIKDWDDGTGPHLDAFPMEGDLWEHSLTKEIVLDSNVHASHAEIAACCLWHTSFYGFVQGQQKMWVSGDYKTKAERIKSTILSQGGHVPSKRELLPSKKQELIERAKEEFWVGNKKANKTKRKCLFRHAFMEQYYERMVAIGSFIVKVLPALSMEANPLTIDQLCKLFVSGSFRSVTIPSFADEATDAIRYMVDLLSQYDMLPHADNAIVYLSIGHEWDESPVFHSHVNELLKAVARQVFATEGNKGTMDLILDYHPFLGHQIEMTVVTTDISVSR